MARTLSAARGSDFAGVMASRGWQRGAVSRLIAAGHHDPHRALLIMVAVALVIAGAVVPHLNDESLSTLLFLAGTGLAAALIWAPAETRHSGVTEVAAPKSRLPKASVLPARFSELLARPSNPTLDRAAWARLTAHMSHELRTPLNAVLGFSEVMSNEVFGPLGSSLYSSYARDIHTSGRQLLKSAEDALAITSLLTAERRGTATANIADLAAEAVAFVSPDLNARSIAVDVGIASALTIVAEPQTVRQIVINLVVEAAANAADGATLTIGTRLANQAVQLAIEVSDASASPVAGNGFPIMLARTLCELSGAKLACPDLSDDTPKWTVDFVAAQNDLFN